MGPLGHRWWESTLVQLLWETACRGLRKLNIEVPYDLGTLLLGIYPVDLKAGI